VVAFSLKYIMSEAKLYFKEKARKSNEHLYSKVFYNFYLQIQMSQLSYEKCIQLEVLVGYWVTHQTKLSKELWCSQSTISRELSKAKELWIPYNAKFLREQRELNRLRVNQDIHCKIISNNSVSHTTIYAYIYIHLLDLIPIALRRRWKKYKYRGWWTKSKIPNRISIHERPVEVESRDMIWHFEWDTIVWKNKWDRIATVVDRKSRYLFAGLVMQSVKELLSINTSMAIFGKLFWLKWLLSITFDNWTEFCDHEYLIEQLKIKTYFADPYSSRQRWTNENTNWLLREFLPKWTDFSKITQAMLDKYVDMINNRPRKCLEWKTPSEVFFWS
jgi:IS30 family transposase